MADWKKLKREYIQTAISTRALAEKYDISYGTLRGRAEREKWTDAREEYQRKLSANSAQKTAEKISDSESEIAAIRSRVHLKLMQEVERQTDAIMSGDMNSADLRRIVQSYKDMCDIVVETVGDEKQHNALVSAIREAAERRRGHD